MVQKRKSPRWTSIVFGVLAVALTVRYLAIIEAGVTHTVAIRTWVFWALMSAPVAYLADMVVRSVLEYRVVRLAVDRVQQRRQRN